MDKDIIIGKLVLSVDEFMVPLRTALDQAYAAGWGEGRKSLGGHRRVKIELYVKDCLKDSFDSEKEASKITRDSESTIKRSLRSGIATKKGHIWKYKTN